MVQVFFRVRPEQIALLRFLLEAYDGLATLSTLDSGQGLIVITVARGQYQDLWLLLERLAPELCPIMQCES